MRKVLYFGLFVGAFVWGYVRGFDDGEEKGRLEGARKAMADLGVSDETILSQTT